MPGAKQCVVEQRLGAALMTARAANANSLKLAGERGLIPASALRILERRTALAIRQCRFGKAGRSPVPLVAPRRWDTGTSAASHGAVLRARNAHLKSALAAV